MSSGTYNLFQQPVVNSISIYQHDNDSFFNPILLQHTGFACDGNWYDAGVLNQSKNAASWFTEAPSSTRGTQPAFPKAAVVLLNKASLAILSEDLSTSKIATWMIFYLNGPHAFTNNPFIYGATMGSGAGGFSPQQLYWANGLLSLFCTPDAGSQIPYPVILSVDFVRDEVYFDISTPKS